MNVNETTLQPIHVGIQNKKLPLANKPASFYITLLCSIAAVLWLIPFLWMFAAALRPDSGGADIASIIPQFPISFNYFSEALESAEWITLYTNTFIFTFGTLAAQLFCIITSGYVFAFVEFKHKELVFKLFLVQLMLMPVILMVPNMLMLKKIGLLDTLLGAMMPYFASAFGVFMVRQAFKGVPAEMIDAALVEGGSLPQIFIHILIPAIWPVLLTFSIISVTAHWNEYLWPLMALSNPDTHVLTIGLVSFAMSAESGAEWGLIAAGTLMVCFPIFIAFVLFQKQFINSFGYTEFK